MLKRLLQVISAVALVTAAFPTQANLLTAADFDTTTLYGPSGPDTDGKWRISTSLDKWLQLQFTTALFGPSGGATDKYAKHSTSGGGSDQKLVQFINASGLAAGQTLTLEFDYIYAEASGQDPQARVSLVGFSVDRLYTMFGGGGVDGLAGGGDFAVAAPDVLLAQTTLPYVADWSLDRTLSATLAASYPYIGVVFSAGCYLPPGTTLSCNTLRGIDNISLIATGSAAPIPEPGTIMLLGLGLAGLAAARRRKQ